MPRKPKTKAAPVKKSALRTAKRELDAQSMRELEERIAALDPATIEQFDELPLSKQTAQGLKQSHFTRLTDIQKASIPVALRGRDILGAAKTGSGKTLAFLVPLLEALYRANWTPYDGLGALVISPTRELAIQIFEVLRKIGRAHSFSAGLVIGGKDVQVERERISRLNILICTPGRLLQHMDQAAGFETGNLKMLVLDEADRILDMGFRSTLDAIVEHLPRERQTMLFSATQTKSVSDLARLSLKEPEYIAVHEAATTSTPANLQQYYVVTPLPEKLNALFGFLKTHLKAKIIVFLSSSKQVRFVFETFKTLHPGIPLMHLHGKQKQTARIEITERFSSMKMACLFATDIAARGIDFPAVDWVVQVDCPEDVDTYIHRVGRTARFDKAGRALLMLAPSEEAGMAQRFEARRVPVDKITIKEAKKKSIQAQLQALCFRSPEVKYLGQKAFISYVKSVYLQKDKEVFDVSAVPAEEYAASLGLPGAPRIKFLSGQRAKALKNAPRATADDSGSESEAGEAAKPAVRTKYDRMFERKNQTVLSEHYANLVRDKPLGDDGSDSDGEFMAVKRADHGIGGSDDEAAAGEPTSKRQAKIALSKKLSLRNKPNPTKLVFDDDGNPHQLYEFEDEAAFAAQGPAAAQKAAFVAKEGEMIASADVEDKAVAKEKRKEKRRRRLERERADASDDDDDAGVELAPYDGPDADDGSASDASAGPAGPARSPSPEPKRKWFQQDAPRKRARRDVVEVEEPATLADLEALSMKLLGN
ncbi:P-loop containing nucleoside triphosphate hydrolase protein [Dipodascopsis tothii]|uniref:P-loop containing nucleoside triphosphate hydrolase protein n=1 Tax=Dipodascopsis tothii TaxID=44089 RepID=UPI0034CD18C9